jgi:hypothetical protein
VNTTHSNSHLIPTNGTVRGTLHYTVGLDHTIKVVQGEFYRNPKFNLSIIGRKFRCRNWFHIANEYQVCLFVPAVKAGE